MNVLILTPDRVGSTLLQRLLTVYMLRKEFGQPVINLHELTNGLERYYNPVLGREVLGKPKGTDWGYFQSLPKVIDLLKSVDHFKTSRLAHYHLVNRKDPIAEQIEFYQYLNENFFIISCRRENLLEHVLSWGIQAHSKKLNVYSAQEKISTFDQIYKQGITIPRETIFNYLNKYKDYIAWSDQYFNVQSYFEYDSYIHNMEDYILNLPFMQDSTDNSWNDMFGQSFDKWNACHRMLPNIKLLEDSRETQKEISFIPAPVAAGHWAKLRGNSWPKTVIEYEANKESYPVAVREEIKKVYGEVTIKVTDNEYKFLQNNLTNYVDINSQLQQLVVDGFLVTNVPVKLQSLQEKKSIIKNFDQCIFWYNEWVRLNNFGKIYTESELDNISVQEEEKLNNRIVEQLSANKDNARLN